MDRAHGDGSASKKDHCEKAGESELQGNKPQNPYKKTCTAESGAWNSSTVWSTDRSAGPDKLVPDLIPPENNH